MTGPVEELSEAITAAERQLALAVAEVLDRLTARVREVLGESDVDLVPVVEPVRPLRTWMAGDPEPANPVGIEALAGDGRVWIRRGTRWAYALDTCDWPGLLAMGPVLEVRGG